MTGVARPYDTSPLHQTADLPAMNDLPNTDGTGLDRVRPPSSHPFSNPRTFDLRHWVRHWA